MCVFVRTRVLSVRVSVFVCVGGGLVLVRCMEFWKEIYLCEYIRLNSSYLTVTASLLALCRCSLAPREHIGEVSRLAEV